MYRLNREINPDLIKNVQKYIDWMPMGLNLEVVREIINKDIDVDFDIDSIGAPISQKVAFIMAAISRSPTNSSPKDQTEWVKSIINDLRITPIEPDSSVHRWDIAHFLTNDKEEQRDWNNGYCGGWNGNMWDGLLDAVEMNNLDEFIRREKKRGIDYGVAWKEIIFSERQSNFNFLNWKGGPFEVKQ